MNTSNRKLNWTLGLAALTIVLGGFVAAKYSESAYRGDGDPPVVYKQQEPPAISDQEAHRAMASAKDLSVAFRVASERVLPSVVAIETRSRPVQTSSEDRLPDRMPKGSNPFAGTPFEDLFRNFNSDDRFQFQMPSPDMIPQQGLGSGVIIDQSGLIMTNNHVVRLGGRAQVTVRLQDGREFTAARVWTDPKTDIAIIKIDGATDLVPAKLGDSDRMAVGDWVLALGQPFGLESTVTAGIISATHRGVGINERENFLQTDAAINPGNSGGPLVNLEGEVVGINTAISSRSGSNSGVGFAIPINIAKWVGDQLVANGKVHRSYLGVGVQQIDSLLADRLGVKPREGVAVTQVYPSTPAERAGLKTGDVILDFAGLKVQSPRDLQFAVERATQGRKHAATVLRGKQTLNIELVPEEMPAEVSTMAEASDDNPLAPGSQSMGGFGLEVTDLTPDVAARLGEKDVQGVVITRVESGGAAEQAGLQSGMIILQVNGSDVHDVKACQSALEQSQTDPLLLVRANGASRFVVLKKSTRG
jgi:serine protease Do